MISAHYARVLHRLLLDAGVDEAALLEGCNLDGHRIWTDHKLDPEKFLRFLRNARTLTGERHMMPLVGSRNRLAALGMIGMAMMSAPTLRDGLQAMVSYSVLEADYIRLQVLVGRDSARVIMETDRDLGDCLDLHAEAVLLLVQDYIEDVVGETAGMRFNVPYNGLEGRAEVYADIFHGPVCFEAAVVGLDLPTEWLSRQSPYRNESAWLLARQHLSSQLQEVQDTDATPFTLLVRGVMAAHPPPLPNSGYIADTLHVSTRTLNRRLHAEGTTFRQLKLEATHNWSQRMLLDGNAVETIAFDLGYGNAANFRRFFKAFAGCSPTEWLSRQAAH